jgi:hypothetical protein
MSVSQGFCYYSSYALLLQKEKPNIISGIRFILVDIF